MKPTIIAASAGSITALVPTRLAMTPPRSMSPTSTTGTSAARAKPMLAMSPARRLTSDADPAPSTSTRSHSAARRPKLSSTAPSSLGFSAWYSRALALPKTLPCTTTWAPISLWGFSSTGFMCTLGGTRAARACSAWARPISPPSAVTAALFDMFCGLNGRTLRPAPREDAGKACHQQRLADVGARALDHEDAGGHQNSMPSCAFTPAAKWCFTGVISVTRSAASISSGLALRPVTTMCWSLRRAFSASTTSLMSR